MSSLVSIIIPTYNHAAWISETIESVLEQDYIEMEIIVVNDGSTDKTEEILDNYKDRITVIHQENSGVSAARNAGLARATGRYLVFVDSDDLLTPGIISSQVAFMDAHDNIAASFTQVTCFSVNDNRRIREWDMPVKPKRIKKLGNPEENQWFFLNQNFWPPGSVMLRTNCVKELGGFSTVHQGVEDFDLFFRIGAKHQIAVRNVNGLRYRILRGSISDNKNSMQEDYLRLVANLRNTEYYRNLSSWRKSVNSLYVGGALLLYKDIPGAINEFQQALRLHPGNLASLVALIATSVFRNKIVQIFTFIRRWIP